MIDETNHELLSAYLDGELSADERQRVEKLLAENGECRQVYKELCALRASLAGLPRQTLNKDIGSEVIRAAQQSLPGKAKTPGVVSRRREDDGAMETAAGQIGGMSAAERKSRAWRTILYPLLAVAAAVAMLVTSPKEKAGRERQMAQAPVKPAPPAEMSAPADQEALPELSVADDAQLPADGNAKSKNLLDDEKENAARDTAARGHSAGENRVSPGTAGYLSKKDRTPPESKAMKNTLIAGGVDRKSGSESPPANLVIDCKLAPTAARNKAFDALLARNHLVASSEAAQSAASGSAGKEPPAAAGPVVASNRAQGAKKGVDQTEAMPTGSARSDQEQSWSKSVMVELDARQLAAVLADLKEHPDQFLSVELPAEPSVERERATRLNASADDTLSPAGKAASSNSVAAPAPAEKSAPADQDEFDANGVRLDSQASDGGGLKRLRVLFRLSAARGE